MDARFDDDDDDDGRRRGTRDVALTVVVALIIITELDETVWLVVINDVSLTKVKQKSDID